MSARGERSGVLAPDRDIPAGGTSARVCGRQCLCCGWCRPLRSSRSRWPATTAAAKAHARDPGQRSAPVRHPHPIRSRAFGEYCPCSRCHLGGAAAGARPTGRRADVTPTGLFGPAVLGAASGAEPEDRPEESRAAGRVADCDGGVIDTQKRAGTVAPCSRDGSCREGKQFQRVAVLIAELERRHPPDSPGSRTGPWRLMGRNRRLAMTRR